jgi:hypothetical protein
MLIAKIAVRGAPFRPRDIARELSKSVDRSKLILTKEYIRIHIYKYAYTRVCMYTCVQKQMRTCKCVCISIGFRHEMAEDVNEH